MAADSGSSFSSSGSWSITDVIFLCYARADRAQVDSIAAALRARGASVWYDAASAAGSAAYVEASQRALRRSALMLVFLSASALKSPWVVDEARAYRALMARDPGHSLLAVHLDKTRLPIWLAGVSAIDAHGAAPADVASQIASVSGLGSLAVAPAPSRPAATAAPVATPTPSAAVATSAPAPVASGPVYVSYDPADSARVQPLIGALRGQGATLAENGAAGLQQAQTLLVAISAASAGSVTVGDDIAAFHALAANDASRAVIGMHLDQTASPAGLNGAGAVDSQGLAPEDTARLIVASLPAGAAAVAAVAEPEASAVDDSAAAPIPDMEPETSMPATPAPAMEAEATTVVPPAHDFTDAAPVEEAPAMDAIETGIGAGASMVAMDSAMAATAPAVDAAAAMPEPSPIETPPAEEAPIEAAPVEATPAMEAAPATEAEPVVEDAVVEPAPAEAEAVVMTETAPAMAAIPPATPAPVSQPAAVVASLREEQANITKPDMLEVAKPASNTGSIIAMVIIVLALVALTIGLWISAGMPQ